MKRQKWDPNYSNLIAKDSAGILILDRPIEHRCECGVVFMGNRNALYCVACKPAARIRMIQRSQDKQKKKRAVARAERMARGAA